MTNEGSLRSKDVKRSKRAGVLLAGIFAGCGRGGRTNRRKNRIEAIS